MHGPKLALSCGKFRCFCGLLVECLARLRHVSEDEAELSRVRFSHPLQYRKRLHAIRALVIAVFDQGYGRIRRAINVVVFDNGARLHGPEGTPETRAGGAEFDRCQPDVNPIRACVPSQKGLLALPPQRHRRACWTRATTRPVPLVISRLPRTCSGPSVCGSTASGPLRTASMSAAPVGGSPEAAKLTS